MLPLSYIFWILMLLWVLAGPGYGFIVETPNRRVVTISNLLLFLLFVVIGLKIFWSSSGIH